MLRQVVFYHQTKSSLQNGCFDVSDQTFKSSHGLLNQNEGVG